MAILKLKNIKFTTIGLLNGQTKWVYFLIEDDDLLGKLLLFGIKSALIYIKKEFDSEPIYNKNYLKTKVKSHGYEATDFYNNQIPN